MPFPDEKTRGAPPPHERPSGPSLWLRLWLAYTFISFFGVTAILLVSTLIDWRQAYKKAYTEENLRLFLEGEIDAAPWRDRVRSDGLPYDQELQAALKRLMRFDSKDPIVVGFPLDRVSDPSVSVHVLDAEGTVLVEAASGDTAPPTSGLYAELKLSGIYEGLTVNALLSAPYRLEAALATSMHSSLRAGPWILLISTIIGLLCSVASARYITRRLDIMNATTARWRLGRFDQMIELKAGDELGLHAQRLNAMASELEAHLNVKQALAVSNERNRIARDLHDTVKQNLFALGLQLAVVRSALGKDHEATSVCDISLAEAETIAQEAQRDLVAIIEQLRPADSAPQTLGAALSTAGENLARRLSTQVQIEVSDDFEAPPRTEIAILRALRELVTNAVRHGEASEVLAQLRSGDASAELIVTDNGVGFDPESVRKGLGLKSVEDRVAELPGGVFEVQSSPGHGARMTMRWDQTHG